MKLANTQKASQLHNDMTFRAEREHQRHDLAPRFHRQHLDAVITTFLGVDVGPNGIECDTQQPLIFRHWTAQLARRRLKPFRRKLPRTFVARKCTALGVN
jgi:hypothetical protein